MLVGYARVSRDVQDTEHQERQLRALGIPPERIYLDHGFTGRNTNRPGLATALAVVREGDTLCVVKLDRLARSVTDAHRLWSDLTARGVKLRVGGETYDPRSPMGKLLFTVLAMIAEFEADLISQRTREGLATAKARGKLTGRPPKLPAERERRLVARVLAGELIADVALDFGVGRSTVYRALARAGVTRADLGHGQGHWRRGEPAA